ncbi:hypothetical protein, unknown function [Leishmania infantum JPCM5]|uniref:PPPDE_putative_peptidase_domain_containing_protein_-__putative n=2 Tax=Leishmania infantum TaxID=5671 RepID=A0A6L0WJB9_LEIIN|nr:hypothetical protein, unknown function [Leishmania infantum JPCM5]CAC9455441.1 PPPDE_putative_peptidase_domain_containing_protein_-__putative [Leishmania infantum]CAM65959.1 hypothetical protein, unknown function [Leishmania infantum JPCM5]SUZ39589.1 PPPDE_putative_peptidase_domain_containing_protein_-__putative [Leishmania infantum]|eukprot:XP_001463594.1 hypothetical protein, unknown function [Leishmania infantum JPCM5]
MDGASADGGDGAPASAERHSLKPLMWIEEVRDASQPNAVFLNVYDVSGSSTLLCSVGWGVHHVGVQVYGKEYQYGHRPIGKGIGSVKPRHSPPHTYREQFFLGQTQLSAFEVEKLVVAFSEKVEWLGNNYHLVKHNCIDFARAFCEALLPPAVRVEQARRAEEAGLPQKMHMVEVEVDGMRHSVPLLIPHHVDRLARYAAHYLPKSSMRSFDRLESSFFSMSEVPQERGQPTAADPNANRSTTPTPQPRTRTGH